MRRGFDAPEAAKRPRKHAMPILVDIIPRRWGTCGIGAVLGGIVGIRRRVSVESLVRPPISYPVSQHPMRESAVFDRIRRSSRITGLLARHCNFFVLGEDAHEDPWFKLKSGEQLEIIATDGSGGVFALCGKPTAEGRPVLYVSSEGRSGIVAGGLVKLLQTIIHLPYWQDCLKFSGGGNLDEMKKAIPYLESLIAEDEPNIDTLRKELVDALDLAQPTSAIEDLYWAASSTQKEYIVIDEEGWQFESLFNKFSVSDNPTWNRAAD